MKIDTVDTPYGKMSLSSINISLLSDENLAKMYRRAQLALKLKEHITRCYLIPVSTREVWYRWNSLAGIRIMLGKTYVTFINAQGARVRVAVKKLQSVQPNELA